MKQSIRHLLTLTSEKVCKITNKKGQKNMSTKYESFIESEADGLDISVLAVVPTDQPYRGILQLVHGMSEYKERYLPFMEYMAKRGYVCIIHDHRGHGKSVRAAEDLGYMYGGWSRGSFEGY